MRLSLGDRVGCCFSKLLVGIVLILLSDVQIFSTASTPAHTSQPMTPTAVDMSQTMTPTAVDMSQPMTPTAVDMSQPMTPTEQNTSLSVPPTTAATVEASYRLPTSMRPLHYDLELQMYMNVTDPSNFTCRGYVSILLRCDNATDNITLHVNELTVDNTSIRVDPQTPSDSGEPTYISHEQDVKRQFLILRLDTNMEVGKNYWIQMNFTSSITSTQNGLYYSKSKRKAGKIVYTVTSQLESIFARKVFPCFDEPAMKATFNVTLVRPADRRSLSNTEIISNSSSFEEDGTTYVKDVYSQTPLMSTYLLAFVVCDFDYLEATTKSNITVRTWVKPESLNASRYALELAVKLLEFGEEYFDIKYTLPKHELVAVADFEFAAMENWGLSIYREGFMLYTEGVTPEKEYYRATKTIAHEIVHMWVGNLVTHEWWSELWLKESFTAYLESVAVESVNPEWRTFEHLIIDKTHYSFGADNVISSRTVFEDAQTPAEVKALANIVRYVKGPSLVRMLVSVIGESSFRTAYRKLLKKHLYGTINRDDVYRAMQEQIDSDGLNINVKEFMETWVIQRNFPVVTVTQNLYNNSILHVTQERFLKSPDTKHQDTTKAPFNYRWTIPLTLASSKHTIFNETSGHHVYWMYKEEQSKTIHVRIPLPHCADPNGWVLVNLQQYGYYRVNYQVSNWLALIRQLKRNHSVIPVINRAQIIRDAWNLAHSNYTPMHTALATLEYLHNELDYSPWRAAETEINSIATKLESTTLDAPFKKFIQKKLTAPFQHYGLVNISKNHMSKLAQALLSKAACNFYVPACLDQARSVYSSYLASGGQQKIDPDFKESLLCHSIAGGGLQEWEDTLVRYRNSTNEDERLDLIIALACTRDTEIINRFLDMVYADNVTFSSFETFFVIFRVIKTPAGRTLAWNFYKNNFQSLVTRSKYLACDRYLGHSIGHFNREEEIAEVRDFRTRNCPSYDQAAFEKKMVNPIKANMAWANIHGPTVRKWLIKNGISVP